MKYLAVLYDEERSYLFGEESLAAVGKAMKNKTPFQFANGDIVAGGDIRRVEQEGQEKPVLEWNNPNGYYNKILSAPKVEWEKGFWFNCVKLNTEREKKGLPWIFNSTIEEIRDNVGLETPEQIFGYIDSVFTPEMLQEQDRLYNSNLIPEYEGFVVNGVAALYQMNHF